MFRLASIALISGCLVFPAVASAGDLVVYPAKGQSAEQMEQDKYQCYSWAKGQTGFDPMAVPKTSSPPPQQGAQKGGAGRGAVKGGIAGGVIGGIAGDAGKGAGIGAATGAIAGGVRRRNQQQEQQQAEQQWAQQEANKYAEARTAYNRNYAACLEGRGYSVK